MNKYLKGFFFSALTFSIHTVSAQSTDTSTTSTPSPTTTPTTTPTSVYPAMTPSQQTQFQQSLEAGIRKSEQHMKDVLNSMTGPDHLVSPIDRLQLKDAKETLKAKQIIYSNLAGTPSMQSPVVRNQLIKILNQDKITESDLYSLQDLINQERAKMGLPPAKP